MIKNKFKTVVLLVLAIGIEKLNAQSAIVASGGSAINTDGSVAYSIGQLDYISIISPYGSVSQGVQQPVVSIALPIALFGLQVYKQEDHAIISWQTATEINSRYFVVESCN